MTTLCSISTTIHEWGRRRALTVQVRAGLRRRARTGGGHRGSRTYGGEVTVETGQENVPESDREVRDAGRAPDWLGPTRKAVRFAHARALFALHAVSVGPLPQVYGRVALRCQGELRIGERLVIDGWPLATKISVGREGRLVVGDRAFLNYGVDINAQTSIVIGDNVRIGPLVSIVDDAMHEVTPGHRRRAPITIGDNVWIGRGAAIGPGVTIGDHAVIGTNSVVTRDVAAATVVGGSPATHIRDIDVPADWRRR
jgi:acetyltransferase-like isoleucine patch superfamily enzyme